MSTQHITVTITSGETITTTTSDPDVASQYEQLPFQSETVTSVTVTVTED
ncbi:hypothetical protein [Streptomyces sp. NPDC015350]